jgi:hypothetical protein
MTPWSHGRDTNSDVGKCKSSDFLFFFLSMFCCFLSQVPGSSFNSENKRELPTSLSIHFDRHSTLKAHSPLKDTFSFFCSFRSTSTTGKQVASDICGDFTFFFFRFDRSLGKKKAGKVPRKKGGN